MLCDLVIAAATAMGWAGSGRAVVAAGAVAAGGIRLCCGRLRGLRGEARGRKREYNAGDQYEKFFHVLRPKKN